MRCAEDETSSKKPDWKMPTKRVYDKPDYYITSSGLPSILSNMQMADQSEKDRLNCLIKANNGKTCESVKLKKCLHNQNVKNCKLLLRPSGKSESDRNSSCNNSNNNNSNSTSYNSNSRLVYDAVLRQSVAPHQQNNRFNANNRKLCR